ETPEAIAAQLKKHDLTLALFNMPAGAWQEGERGIGALPGREAEFRKGVSLALDYARALACKRLHLMAGKTQGLDRSACRETLLGNIRYASDLAHEHGIEVLLEPINTKVDIPGYFYDNTDAVMAIISDAGRPNVRLQYDIYH